MGRLYLLILLTLGAVALEYYFRRDWRKSLIALGSFLLLIGWAILGMTMRTVIPLYLTHLTLIAIGWFALIFYLLKGRYLWWAYWLPALTLLVFVGLNFFEGSRYES
ncbi:hypothetical protein [Nitratifractor salsuginis]|uniref:Uncharacterized protein n=1 Tax=Nitratifractor salsuginis (strain DSM 16511 / JCM 12458 / E9I37-1) TaxID=749222 RepID=E6WZ03_NITSE|nr:hypothetical protein [Nitratifractor salsuginis]ADV45453.1 hypothetical protein Nitsa_0180 [Nitratifractor salsuginis DSM 16511]